MADLARAFTCPCCGKVSRNPNDLEQGYCGACHWWTADPVLGPPHLEGPCEARSLHAAISEGLEAAGRGETADLGSFARYGTEEEAAASAAASRAPAST